MLDGCIEGIEFRAKVKSQVKVDSEASFGWRYSTLYSLNNTFQAAGH